MATEILDNEIVALQRLAAGVGQVAAIVGLGLGPSGRHTVLGRQNDAPQIVSDSNSILQGFELPDAYENLGAQMAIESAKELRNDVGDGTASALLLANALLQQCIRGAAGEFNLLRVIGGMKHALADVRSNLSGLTRTWNSESALERLARRLCQDEGLALIVAAAVNRASPYAPIHVEESESITCSMSRETGFSLDARPVSRRFLEDGGSQELWDTSILITDRTLEATADVVSAMEAAAQESQPLLIVARDITGKALQTLVINHRQGVLPCGAVACASAGEALREDLVDLGVVTGAEPVLSATGATTRQIPAKRLGRAKIATVTATRLTLGGIHDSGKRFEDHLRGLRATLDATQKAAEKERIEERLGRLTRGAIRLRIGAATEADRVFRTNVTHRAIRTLRAAREGGVVPGGGIALLTCSRRLANIIPGLPEFELGRNAVARSLTAIFDRLAINAGIEPETLYDQVGLSSMCWSGYDFEQLKSCELSDAGIVDPYKAVDGAVGIASSLCEQILRTAVLIVQECEGHPTTRA